MKQGGAIRVDSTCSRRRCFNHGNVISSERDDRPRNARGRGSGPRVSGIVNKPCLDIDNLSVQGDVPTPESAIEECVEAVQIIPQERMSECIAEQENRRL